MGGLGANIGSEEWEKARKKLEAAQDYAKSLRQNQILLGLNTSASQSTSAQLSFKKKPHDKQEKTARDRALEFAKSIPKPKVKERGAAGGSLNGGQSENNFDDYQDENGVIEEEAFDEYGNTIKGSDFNDLNVRHDMLQNEVDKIKRMIN